MCKVNVTYSAGLSLAKAVCFWEFCGILKTTNHWNNYKRLLLIFFLYAFQSTLFCYFKPFATHLTFFKKPYFKMCLWKIINLVKQYHKCRSFPNTIFLNFMKFDGFQKHYQTKLWVHLWKLIPANKAFETQLRELIKD